MVEATRMCGSIPPFPNIDMAEKTAFLVPPLGPLNFPFGFCGKSHDLGMHMAMHRYFLMLGCLVDWILKDQDVLRYMEPRPSEISLYLGRVASSSTIYVMSA